MSILSNEALQLLIKNYKFNTIIDVGCGDGHQTKLLSQEGKIVTSTDFVAKFDNVIEGDYMSLNFEQFDAVWCSHVLEHQVNTHLFLKKLIHDCKEDGVIAITVPPLKHEIVGGHVSLWNAGLLLYRMVLAGLDCSNARVGCYKYNISVITQKRSIDLPNLKMGGGDIELLKEFFPMPVKQGFNGNNLNIRWK